MENLIKKNLIDGIHYMIFDPSKNTTALVDTKLDLESYETISKIIMEREKSVEQVGFLSYEKGCDIKLRMAGGEFCGNATMCAAAYAYMKEQKTKTKIKIYSIENPIDVNINIINEIEWNAEVLMPKAKKIDEYNFENGKNHPVVFLEGIAHVIIEIEDISDIDKIKSEIMIKKFCNDLNISAAGLIYYDYKNCKIYPLVYVKNIDTMFWENACASGTTAVGIYLLDKNKKEIKLNIIQPSAASLNVYSINDNIYLKGNVRLISTNNYIK